MELATASRRVQHEKRAARSVGGVNDEHLDEILSKAVRELAMVTKPGDVVLAESELGVTSSRSSTCSRPCKSI